MNDQHPRRHEVRGNTQGPWHVNPASPREIVAGAPGSKCHRLVVVADAAVAPNRDPEDPEFDSNAHLIAAAPKLLEAVQKVADYIDEGDLLEMDDEDALLRANQEVSDLRDELLALIKKAHGEGQR